MIHKMSAIEFDARIKDGKIEIPSSYKDLLCEEVKVILLIGNKASSVNSTNNDNIIDKLLNEPIKLDNFCPFLRKEIYDR